MNPKRPADDDITPIRDSLPEGPPAPVFPVIALWVLLAIAGAGLRMPLDLDGGYGVFQIAGIVAVIVATALSIGLIAGKSVIGRMSGFVGLVMAAGYFVWLFSRKSY